MQAQDLPNLGQAEYGFTDGARIVRARIRETTHLQPAVAQSTARYFKAEAWECDAQGLPESPEGVAAYRGLNGSVELQAIATDDSALLRRVNDLVADVASQALTLAVVNARTQGWIPKA